MTCYLCDTCLRSLSAPKGLTTDGRTFHREWTRCRWRDGWVVQRCTRCEGYKPRDGSTLGVVRK